MNTVFIFLIIFLLGVIIACVYFVRLVRSIIKSKKSITIVGSDGSGKSSLAKALLLELQNMGYSAGIIHLPRYKETGGYPAFFGKYIYGFMSELAERLKSRKMKIFSLLYNGIALLTPISKLIMISKDFIINERHLRIDSVAMSYYYAPNSFLNALATVLTRLESQKPSFVVFVDLHNPRIAYKRIKDRLLLDKKYPHLHEKSLNLLRLSQKRYREIIQKIQTGKTTIIRVDGSNPIMFNVISVIETLKNIGFLKEKAAKGKSKKRKRKKRAEKKGLATI
ncbi:MAG: hypothetical protein BAJALOKI1v1_1770002 [Promethearchaeota archaeon]|nr:MAG: hypothetical protein BAJALOKI1v1_1770002 [Candidatus Lokiarchaeota archaeon]